MYAVSCKKWGAGRRRTASAVRTYFSKKANHDGSPSTIAVPLRAVTKSIAGCMDVRAAVMFRSGLT